MQFAVTFQGGHEEPIVPDLLAKDNPAADWRNMRRIIAEDDEWTLATVPQLTELCIQHIVSNFESEYCCGQFTVAQEDARL